MNKEETIGNLTTIIKVLIITFAPLTLTYINIDQLTILIIAILGLIFSLIDAKYKNTIINNNNNDEYE